MNWYSKCSVVVRWENSLSDSFMIPVGVRQGGVLSPILFALYINDIVSALYNSKLDCSINGVYLGCTFYADYIILVSTSNFCMQAMLDI